MSWMKATLVRSKVCPRLYQCLNNHCWFYSLLNTSRVVCGQFVHDQHAYTSPRTSGIFTSEGGDRERPGHRWKRAGMGCWQQGVSGFGSVDCHTDTWHTCVHRNMYTAWVDHTSACTRPHESSTSRTLETPWGLSVLALLFSKVTGGGKTLGCVHTVLHWQQREC